MKKNIAVPARPDRDALFLVRGEDGGFVIAADVPEWFSRMFPGRFREGDGIGVVDMFAYLEFFLDHAVDAWKGGTASFVESDVWTQCFPDGTEIQLVATATIIDGQAVLLVHSDVGQWHEKRRILQTARENTLEHEALVRAEQMLEQGQSRLRLILAHLPSIVWTAGMDMRVSAIYGSPEQLQALTEYLRMPIERLVGLTIDSIFDEDGFTPPITGAHRLALEGICVDFELQVGRVPFECHIEPMRASDGSVTSLIGIARDVSQQRDAENERILAAQKDERAALAEAHVRELKAEIDLRLKAEKKLKAAMRSLNQTLESAILAMARALETRDAYTAGHQQRVAVLSREIAREMGLKEERAHQIYLTGLIHDLGKIAVPFEILGKPGTLTPIEFNLVKIHPAAGYDILSSIEFPWPLATIVRQHHECLDGSGYPDGLKGDEIMLEARIISVADIIESVGSHRPYRPSMGLDAAFKLVLDGRGTRYDPDVVDACVRVFGEKGFRFE